MCNWKIVPEQYCCSYTTKEPGEIQKEFLKCLDWIGKEYHWYVESNKAGSIAPAQDCTSFPAKAVKRQRRWWHIDTVSLYTFILVPSNWPMLPWLKALSKSAHSYWVSWNIAPLHTNLEKSYPRVRWVRMKVIIRIRVVCYRGGGSRQSKFSGNHQRQPNGFGLWTLSLCWNQD